MRLLSRTIALAGALILVAVPTAGAQSSSDVEKLGLPVLRAHETGSIDPCRFSLEQLEAALELGQRNDVKQYASDFAGAVREAISARARGACDEPTPTPTPVETAAPTAPPTTGGSGPGKPAGPDTQTVVPEPPGPAGADAAATLTGPDPALEGASAASPGNGTPVPLIGLGVLSALSLLTVLMLGALRRLGESGGPLAPAYHSWREAQWRAGGVLGDFRDWLKLGR